MNGNFHVCLCGHYVVYFALICSLKLIIECRNHTFLFVSGWPQSGTSMVHKMVSLHPHISTVMEKCLKIHGKRCENWNYEGQWLLNSTSRNVMGSGKMCNKLGATTSEMEQVREQVRVNILLNCSLNFDVLIVWRYFCSG